MMNKACATNDRAIHIHLPYAQNICQNSHFQITVLLFVHHLLLMSPCKAEQWFPDKKKAEVVFHI